MKAKNFKYKKQDWQEKYLTNSTNESLIFLFSNPFHANLPFLYHQKMTENLWFSLVFRGYENGTMAWSELKGPWGQKLNPVFFLYNSNDFIEKEYRTKFCDVLVSSHKMMRLQSFESGVGDVIRGNVQSISLLVCFAYVMRCAI